MSSPPDFLGLALGMIRQQQQARESRAQEAQQRDRFELQMRRHEEAQQQDAEKQALTYVQAGGELKTAEGLWGNHLRESFRPLLKEEAKAAKARLEREASMPKGAEQQDIAKGVAGILDQPGDPLKSALSALRSVPDQYPPDITNRILMRGGAIGADRNARAARETARMQEQSDITEARQSRRDAGRAALKAQAKTEKPPKELQAPVRAAWETYVAAGVPFDEWRQDPSLPKSVIANAMKHPQYVEMLKAQKQFSAGQVQVPYRLGEGTPTVPTAPTAPKAGEWVDVGGGVRIRKK